MSYKAKPKFKPPQAGQQIDMGFIDAFGDPVILQDPEFKFDQISILPNNKAKFAIKVKELFHEHYFEYVVDNLVNEPVIFDPVTGMVTLTIQAQLFKDNQGNGGHDVIKHFEQQP